MRPRYFIAAAVLMGAPQCLADGEPCPNGLVVEELQKGFAADRAGLKPGDVLCKWERAAAPPANPEPAQSVLVLSFDVQEVEVEQGPRGTVTLWGTRDGDPFAVRMSPGEWRMRARPPLNEAERKAYEEARALLGGENYEKGLSLWREMAVALREAGDQSRAAWLFHRVGSIAAGKRRWEIADPAFREARLEAETAGHRAALAPILSAIARTFEDRSDWDRAVAAHDESLQIRRALAAASLTEAWCLHNLGIVAERRGDLATSEERHRSALEIREALAPHSLDVAASLTNLGLVTIQRGDLVVADEQHRTALEIRQRLAPQNLEVATSLHNLGYVAHARGELAAAEEYFKGSLAIKDRLDPGTLPVANSLHNLGVIAKERGDLAAAEDYVQRALAIRRKLAPDSPELAAGLNELGEIAWQRGHAAQARAHLEAALAATARVAPRKLLVAETVRLLGDIALGSGDLPDAEAHYRRCLDIRRELAPGSAEEAEAYQRLAAVERRRGRPEQALDLYRRALQALDAQRRRFGGTDEAVSRFGARHGDYYREAVDLLVEMHRSEEAFHVLERYRARALLALLARRDLAFPADIPAELDDERRRANAAYDQALARLADANGNPLGEMQAALGAARRQQAAVQDKVRAASPRLAELQDPQPLDLAGTRTALDSGTLLLSYSVADDRSYVFAVGPGADDFEAVRLDTDAKKLRTDVARFRELLQAQATLRRKQLDRVGRDLGATLLGPLSERLRRAERVVIVPDGPLHVLPFAALADPATHGRYLVQSKPVHVAASATVFAELKKARRSTRTARVVAFGDPDYSAVASLPPGRRPTPELRSARERGLELRPLPSSRREVDDLRRLFAEASTVYVGAEATEENAKADSRGASLIHFACHGLADERSPLDSSLALSMPADWKPGQANGLLQAWEIFEQIRIDADLVTLSACDTALGKEMSGEGILGLTRAFQYAGARSVLASLWAVRDDSTADLMRRFYAHLHGGKTKDAALRAAQVEMIRRGRSSHPGRWAAFQLVGDWK